jgi:GntR family transcriptional regulator
MMKGKKVIGRINKDLPIPLYFQVMQILQKEIEDGKYPPGSYIPTEAQLQEQFNVSRATIRQALSELVHQGYLERRRSKGTIVAGVKLEENLQELCSFTDQFIRKGIQLVTKIIEFQTIECPEKIASNLEINPGDPIFSMMRLRMVEDAPVALERWYAPESYFPGLSKDMFGETGFEQSTYYILYKNYELKVTKAEDSMSPVSLRQDEAELLCVDEGVPALLRTRLSYNATGIPVSYGSGIYLIKIKMILVSK